MKPFTAFIKTLNENAAKGIQEKHSFRILARDSNSKSITPVFVLEHTEQGALDKVRQLLASDIIIDKIEKME